MKKAIITAATITAVAAPAYAGMICDVTDNDNPGFFYEVTGDLILRHFPDPIDGGTSVWGVWKCDKSETRPDGETQCVREMSDPTAYSAIKILPDEGMALISWGNLSLDNHVVTYDPIECVEQ